MTGLVEAMFEYFFAKRTQERERSNDVRALNYALTGGRERRTEARVINDCGDSATSLPQGFLPHTKFD